MKNILKNRAFLGYKSAIYIISAVFLTFFLAPLFVMAAPSVTTNSAARILNTEANVYGYVTASSQSPVAMWAEWGPTTNLGHAAETITKQMLSFSFEKRIYRLSPNTIYYYRIVAQDSSGKTYGNILSFRTANGIQPGISFGTAVSNGNTTDTTINGSSNQSAPSVSTTFASNIAQNSLTMNGFINPYGTYNTYRWFEWGTMQSLGTISGNLYAGAQPHSFSFTITGLQPGTTYYFRAVGRNSYGTVNGSIFSATTLATNQDSVSTSTVAVAPLVITRPPIIADTNATLNADIIAGSVPVIKGYFEFGNAADNLSTGTSPQSLQNNYTMNAIQSRIVNLVPQKTYYYRAVVQDASLQTYRSNVASFNALAYAPKPAGNILATVQQQKPALASVATTKQNESENKENAEKSALFAGTLFSNISFTILGWMLALVLLMIVIVLIILLRQKNKQINGSESGIKNGGKLGNLPEFPEFPPEFHADPTKQ